MKQAAISVLVFGVYLALMGLTLLIIPNIFFGLINVEPTDEVWIRLCGILIMALSVYYIVAAKNQLSLILKVTVFIRCTIIIFFAVFVSLNMMKAVMLIFAAIDFAGGVWTYIAMKKENLW